MKQLYRLSWRIPFFGKLASQSTPGYAAFILHHQDLAITLAGQVALTVLAALMGSYHQATWDKEQKIVVTLVTTPIKNSKQIEARVSFDRRLTNNIGQLWRTELILDAPIYQEFFEKLSKSAFLEAHKL